MFSNNIQLMKRTPVNGIDRENFLSLLVDEYINSVSIDAKSQVLANLANFAYDPINYGYMRNVGVLDIFLFVIKNEKNQKLLHFATSGICNLCIDPVNSEYIATNGGIKPIVELLKCIEKNVLVNAITILYYMHNDSNIIKAEVSTPDISKLIVSCKNSDDKRLSNIATIFCADIYGNKS